MPTDIQTVKYLDQATSLLTNIIQKALTDNAPSLKIPITLKKPTWWNEEVLQARQALRTSHHLWHKNKTPSLH
jgi:hypothetical protein